ncbi:hypothetical protein LSH36_5g05011 [Paralvinella palmiformis]|uniref:Ig-like domain-containing protein n=1 Tax=Paralvinella palmiformis TaxID=53620 RepID=A0AAD9KF06_9ANNE|nr:hypothetical protein LSH36_5g05011 [Paralvinella palmiformis]
MGYTVSIWLLAALTALHKGYGQDPKVTIRNTQPTTFLELQGRVNEKVINAVRVQDVTMSCYVEDLGPGMLVRWRKTYKTSNNEVGQVFISTDLAITDNTKYSVEKPTDYTWRLRVRDTQIWDEGVYECYVQLTELSVAHDTRIVRVLVPPYLTPAMVSPDTTVTEGEDINLLCNATGRPEPMIEWTRLGGAVLPNGREKHMGGMLPIRNVHAKDRGQYRCHVWNSIGQIKRDILLDVKFQPVVTAGNNAVVYQAPGYSTTLQCFVEANPAPQQGEMKWAKGSLSYTVSTQKYIIRTIEGAFDRLTYEMIIDGVSEEDYGTYTCHISNSMIDGPSVRQNVRLAKSAEPVSSPKVGRVVKAGEWQRRFKGLLMRTNGSTSCFVVSSISTIMCLVVILL